MDIRTLIGSPRGNEIFFIECPFHGDSGRPNMAVYADGTYCFRCGASETESEFTRRAASETITVARRGGDRKPARPVERWQVDVYHRILTNQRHHRIEWFRRRGFWDETLVDHKIGHTGEKFVIPVQDRWGQVQGLHYRIDPEYYPPPTYYDEGPPKYLNPRGQSGLIYAPGSRNRGPIIICEGPLDALLLAQMRWNAVTTTEGSGSLAKRLTHLPDTDIYIATDNDEAGEEAYVALLNFYPKARRVRLPLGMDVTDTMLSVEPMERNDLWKQLLREAV